MQTRYRITLTYRIGLRRWAARLRENFIPMLQSSLFLWFSAITVLSVLSNSFSVWFVWLLAEITLLFVQGVFWDYHFIPFIPILSALSANFFTLNGRVSQSILITGFALLIHDLLKRAFFLMRTKEAGKIRSFKKHKQLEYAPSIGKLIRKNSEASERIFVWGHLVQVYILSERAAEDSYLFYISPPYSSAHAEYLQHIIERFRKKPPAFVLLSRPDFNIRYLEELTGAAYRIFRRFGQNMALYKYYPTGKVRLNLKNETTDIARLTLDPGVFYDAAANALRDGSQEAAWKQITKLLKYKPMDAGGLFLLGTWLRKEGNSSSAILVFERFLQQKPLDSMAHMELLKLYLDKYLKSKDRMYAARVIKSILGIEVKTEPKNYNILCDMGDAWNKVGRYKEAEELLNKAARCGGGRLRCYYILGKMLMGRGKLQKALSYFEKGLKADKSLFEEREYLVSILYYSGSILQQTGEISKSEVMLKKCISICPEHKKAKEILFKIPNCNNHMLQ